MLSAFRQLLEARPGVRLTLIGGCHPTFPEQILRAECLRVGIEESVDFRGPIPRPDLIRVLQKTKLIVCPSYYETFG